MQTTPIFSAVFLAGALVAGCRRHPSKPPRAPAVATSARTSIDAPDASATNGADLPSERVVGRFVYEGTIADRPVLMRIRCDARGCSGKYFYEAIGETLDLRASGPARFDEHVGGNARVSGHLVFDSAPGGEEWNGKFVSESKSAQPSIRLARIEPPARSERKDAGVAVVPRALKRTFHQASPKDAGCKVTVTAFEIVGLADADIEDRINGALDPAALAKDFVLPADGPATEMCGESSAKCDVTANGYRILCRDSNDRGGLFLNQTVKVTLLDEHLLSARDDYGFDGGGAHPSDGVGGVTIDLHDGHVLDARDFLKNATPEPDWTKYVTPTPSKLPRDLASEGAFALQLGMVASDHERLVADAPQWLDYFLRASGFEMVPNVPEVARVYRREIQHVPFAKVRNLLLANGPASYLYAR